MLKILWLLFSVNCAIANGVDVEAQQIYKNILCSVCHGQSIAESDVELAKSMRLYIRNQLHLGFDRQYIEQQLTSLYGDQISTKPPFNKHTYLLWLGPLLLFALVSSMAVLKFSKASRFKVN